MKIPKSLMATFAALLLGFGLAIGTALAPPPPSKTVVHYVTRYVTITRVTQEAIALKQCAVASNNEQYGAPGSPKVYGQCVYWVEKAFAK